MFNLKSGKEDAFFKSSGVMSHIFCALKDTVSVPLHTDFTHLVVIILSFLFLPICIHLHFCSLKDNCHIVDQFTKRLISSCNDVSSSSVLIVRYNFVSSANNLQQFFIASGRSFMNITKSIGPKTDPCGIPLFA